MKNFLFSIFVLTTFCACSTTEFSADGKDSYSVGVIPRSEKEVSVEVTKDFYYWGATPKVAEVNFRDELEGVGLYDPSYVSIEERHTFKDVLWTVATLGMYCPVTYKVTLLTNGKVK
ncbi:MAG: Bor family protein [Bdellovibrionales bacterium]|nr:Bor family protein [Bdellovibrionales bacterium]